MFTSPVNNFFIRSHPVITHLFPLFHLVILSFPAEFGLADTTLPTYSSSYLYHCNMSSFDILFLSRPSYCIRFPWSREFEECLRLSRSQFTMPHIYSSLYSCIHAGNHRLVCSTQCERSACVRWGPNLLAASTNALNFPNWLLFLLLWLSNHFSELCIV